MSGRPHDDVQAALSAQLTRRSDELIACHNSETTLREQRDKARDWAVTLEQQLAEAVRLLKAAAVELGGCTPAVVAFLADADPFPCHTCGGSGEIVECVNDGKAGCSHTNDREYQCPTCGGLG